MLTGPEMGARVRLLRKQKKMTKVVFGQKFGVGARTVYTWETKGPPIWARWALAAFVYELKPWPFEGAK